MSTPVPPGLVATSCELEEIFPETLEWDDRPIEAAGFEGRLDDLRLSSLLSVLEMEENTGILTLILEPQLMKAHLHVSEGRVVHARLDAEEEPRDAELVFSLFACTRGTFDFRVSGVSPEDAIGCSTTGLIFEGVRRMGEARQAPPWELGKSPAWPGNGQPPEGEDEGLGLEAPLASCDGGKDEEASTDRSRGEPEIALKATTSETPRRSTRGTLRHRKRCAHPDLERRLPFAPGAVAALLMTSFLLVVFLALWCQDPEGRISHSFSPRAATSISGGGLSHPPRP